ncbi:unnamed protein product [Linum trigynum]|uniref:Uncharacterized protein n=1 Tax=Linum trigynum TaxID=586398 RepID=A0AAV2EKL2_9ROSI
MKSPGLSVLRFTPKKKKEKGRELLGTAGEANSRCRGTWKITTGQMLLQPLGWNPGRRPADRRREIREMRHWMTGRSEETGFWRKHG